jgi:multidrug efflux pump subunit AcrA (membrane-fusion protein)
VRIGFDETTPLLIGMTTEANIITQEKDAALLIPASAVVEDAVWIVGKNGKLTRKTVTIGIRGEEEIEVLSGLRETDKIAATPNAEATP